MAFARVYQQTAVEMLPERAFKAHMIYKEGYTPEEAKELNLSLPKETEEKPKPPVEKTEVMEDPKPNIFDELDANDDPEEWGDFGLGFV